MNTLNVNLENLTEDERETLTALIEKSQKPKVGNLLKPPFKKGEWYLQVNGYGILRELAWGDDRIDRASYALDNAHPDTPQNREMLERRVEQQRAIVEVNRRVRMLIAEQYPIWICDWYSNEKAKFFPTYNHKADSVVTVGTLLCQLQFTFEHAPKGIYEQIDEQLLKKAMGVG